MDLTHKFTPGTRAVAEQVNQNFADVKIAIDPLQTDVADIKTQLTSGIILPDGSVDFTRLQSYKTYTVSNATNATPIVVTAVAHDFITGDKVYISGVGGNTAANGLFTITKVGNDTFTLDNSAGNAVYTSGGTCVLYANVDKNIPTKVYVDTKQLLNLGTVTTETTLTTSKITLAHFSGDVNLVMPSNLPIGVEHTAVINFTTTSTSSPTILQTTTTKTITGASNAGPIVITATEHGYITGDKVVISGVLGNTNANGTWVITRLTADTFSLNGSVGNAAYTSGGTVRRANFKWSDKNGGKSPTSYSTVSGVRNVLVFKTHDGGSNWEAEYSTFGGVETTFVRPNLSANGTLGGASYAVGGDTPGSTPLYYGSDGNQSTNVDFAIGGTKNYIMYNPLPIKAEAITVQNSTATQYNINSYAIYGSNDNYLYTILGSGTILNGAASAIWDAPIIEGNRDYYKYYKFSITAGTNGYGFFAEMSPKGIYITT